MDIVLVGVSLTKDLVMPYDSIVSASNISATSTISSNSLTMHTLTTSGAALHITKAMFWLQALTTQYTWMLIFEDCLSIALCI